MKTKETSYICKKCNGLGKPSKALQNTLVEFIDFPNGKKGDRGNTLSRSGQAILINCIKCISCGHSWIPHEKIFEEQAHLAGAVLELKTNQKQFKEFDPKLFKQYIDKFSDDHKFNMFLVLLKDFKLEPSIESNIMTLVALRNI
jgi:hypothetical protein